MKPEDTPVFTGAELALADCLALVMELLIQRRVVSNETLDPVLEHLEQRYRAHELVSAAGMTRYIRDAVSDPEHTAAVDQLDKLLGDRQQQ